MGILKILGIIVIIIISTLIVVFFYGVISELINPGHIDSLEEKSEVVAEAEVKTKKFKEFLLSNEFSLNINVKEEMYGSFQVIDKNGKCYSPKDKGLIIDDYEFLYNEGYGFGGQGDWNKNEKVYIGYVSIPEEDFKYSKDEFLEYLDMLDEFEYDIVEDMSKDEIKGLIEEVAWDMINQGIVVGLENGNLWGIADEYEFTTWGENGEYKIWDYVFHEQKRYDLDISINWVEKNFMEEEEFYELTEQYVVLYKDGKELGRGRLCISIYENIRFEDDEEHTRQEYDSFIYLNGKLMIPNVDYDDDDTVWDEEREHSVGDIDEIEKIFDELKKLLIKN